MKYKFKEKKDLEIKLIKQGVPQKEIAKHTHLSFSTIAKIRNEFEDDTSEKNNKPKSTQAWAFKIFKKNKIIVHVALELDFRSEQVLTIRL